jgi:electron transfer flavoprotein alpha subunit
VLHYELDKVFVADTVEYSEGRPEVIAAAFTRIIEDTRPALVMMGDTLFSMDIAPRVAYALNVGLVTGCSNIHIEHPDEKTSQIVFTKLIFSGNVVAEYTAESLPVVATLRPRAAMPCKMSESVSGELVSVEFDAQHVRTGTTVLDIVKKVDESNLESAEFVVSGGRGIGSAEGFMLLRDLAKALSGVVASSRPPVDYGWMPPSTQVGQTGKTIAPKVYFAIGISGAIQHLMGIAPSSIIVAINKSADADIFEFAHYGIVGDYDQVVPALSSRIAGLMQPEAH